MSDTRTPNCLVCRGACCEDLLFPVAGLSKPTIDFLSVRCGGTVPLGAKTLAFAFPVRCPHLSADGLCRIYDERPLICSLYIAGGEACLETLRRRRTPEQIEKIME